MRDYRDAKAMAQTLREALSQRHVNLTNSETLELVSKMLGVSDWNTLSATIKGDRGQRVQSKTPGNAGAILPSLPIKDWVLFPAMQVPLWIKRPKTVQALNQAFLHRRELVIVAQKSDSIEDPAAEDVYDIGVTASVLDVGPPKPSNSVRYSKALRKSSCKPKAALRSGTSPPTAESTKSKSTQSMKER